MPDHDTPVLWHIEISHFNEKARWALDWKGVSHIRRAPQPGLHPVTALRLTGSPTLPVLELDGRRIGDSTRIIAALEERHPEPPLYPRDPEVRRRALEIEDFFDEHVAANVRRLVFFHVLGSPDAREVATGISNPGPVRKRLLMLAYPLMSRAVRARYGVREARQGAAIAGIRAGLDRLEAEASSEGYLAGGAFSVADLTAAAILAPLARPQEFPYPLPRYPESLAELLGELDGPALQWVRDTYRRHRPPSAELRSA